MLRPEPAARRQRRRACAHVLAGKPAIGAGREPGRHDHAGALGAAILLHEHGVGARGHRGAGEDANGLALARRPRRGAPRGEAVGHDEPRLAGRLEIGVADRVAVDGRIIERRQIERGDDFLGQHATRGMIEAHPFDLSDWAHALEHQPFDVLDQEQRAAEGEAIVGKLRHQPLPARSFGIATGAARASIVSRMASTSSIASTGTRAEGSGRSDAIATMLGSSGWSSGLPTDSR